MTGDLYFYDFEFNLLDILPRTESVNYSFYYNKIGNAEVHMDIRDKILSFLENKTEMFIDNGGFYQNGTGQWMITGWKCNNNELILFGRSLNFLLSRRVVIPFATVTMTGKELAKKLAADAYTVDRNSFTLKDGRVINIADSSGNKYTLEKQDNFIIRDDVTEEFEASTYRRDTGQTLSDCVIDYLNYNDCGHELIADVKNKQWIFRVYKGMERELTLSEENRNCSDIEKTVEKQDYYNCGFFEKTETDSESNEETEASDRASDWIFVPGDYGYGQPILRFEGILNGSNNSEAASSLRDKKIKESLAAALERLAYERDYRLGDVFRVIYKFGKVSRSVRMRVTGINISCDKDVFEIKPDMEVLTDD